MRTCHATWSYCICLIFEASAKWHMNLHRKFDVFDVDTTRYYIFFFFLFPIRTNFFGSWLSWKPLLLKMLNIFTDGRLLLANECMTMNIFAPLQIWILFLCSPFHNEPMGSKQVTAVAWVSLWHHQRSLKDSWHKGPCWCQWLFGCMSAYIRKL